MRRRDCPVPGCTRGTGPAQLMCRRHWFLVPPVLRSRASRAWLNYGQGRAELPELREAQDAAIASLTPAT